jgi:hypothetical protein
LYKNFERTLVRSHNFFQEYLQGLDAAKSSALVTVSKRISAMVAVLRSLHKNGAESHGFYFTYKHQRDILLMAPPADLPFPSWLAKKMHFTSADLASPKQFWGHVGKDAMRLAGFEDDEIDSKQAIIVADKLTGALAKSTLDETKSALEEFTKSLEDGFRAQLSDDVVTAIGHVQVLLRLPSEPLMKAKAEINEAVLAFADRPILKSFSNFPTGRALLSSAAAKSKELDRVESELSRMTDIVQEFSEFDLQEEVGQIGYFSRLPQLGDAR